ncbi:T9SS type A sorting domain-containing protein [Fulvivirga ulvae]|uniref:T9SS type A sorting domain-containing protein n=1 Tax=Fulvivirga ulvae TaxID=2904245 RepID=UPI001F46D43F|nr:T9SS type A sorting domain-containing protein [Fulvivirga ulvae]UII31639.1 T9SS type A sorting domain-containing protein [Fulvivirga ulvae]
MNKLIVAITFLYFIPFFVLSQGVNEYRTRNSGAWDDADTWERFNGASWVPADDFPTSASADRTAVRNVHSVSISTNIDIDQFRIAGQLEVEAGGVFRINNGGGDDLSIILSGTITVDGVLENQNATFSGVNASNLIVNSGGTYRHLYTTSSGEPPVASWDANSTFEISGFTTTLSVSGNNWTQQFGNVIIDCSALASDQSVSLGGKIQQINGDFIVNSTGSGQVRLNNVESSIINVSGDFRVLGSSNFNINRDGDLTLNISGDMLFNTSRNTLLASYGQTTINLSGSFTMDNTPGTIMNCGLGSGRTTLNVEGDVNITGGTLTEMGSASQGNINFIGNPTSQTQYFTRTGSILNTINYLIEADAIVDLTRNAILGLGDLTVSGVLMVGGLSTDGAIQAYPANSGNIRNGGTRTYNPGSVIIYNGEDVQYLGNGHPGSESPGVDVIINNPNGIEFADNFSELTVTGDLTLQAGNLIVGNNKSLVLNGDLISSSFITVTSTSDITINGTGDFGTFPFPNGDQSLRDFTLDRSSGTVEIQNSLTVNGTLNMTDGDLLLGGDELTLNGEYNRTNGNFSVEDNCIVSIGGSGSLSSFNFLPSGNRFNSFLLTRAGASTGLLSAIELTVLLSVENGATFNSNGFLTLISSADDSFVDARIGPLVDGSSVVGDVTIQRYMSQEGNINRYISSPVQNATVAQLQDDFSITGGFTGTSFPCTGCNNNSHSLRYYLEAANGSISNGYLGYPNSSNTETLETGRGYLAYMWEDVQVSWDLVGNVNSGDIDLNITHTVSTPVNPDADGWNLIGNPYPSPVFWDNGSGWSKTDIAPVIYVPDNASGLFRTWDADSQSGDLPNGVVALGQAFWVYAETTDASLTINENAKTALSGSFFRKGTNEWQELTISLTYDNFTDNSFIIIREDAKPGYEPGRDAPKLQGELFSVSVMENPGERKCVRFATDNSDGTWIYIKAVNEGDYTLTMNSDNSFIEDQHLYLYDIYTGEKYSLSETKTINFTVDSNKESKGARFVLRKNDHNQSVVESPPVNVYPVPAADFINITAYAGVPTHVRIIDSRGRVVYPEVRIDENGDRISAVVDMSGLRSGIYLLVCNINGQVVSKRIIKE